MLAPRSRLRGVGPLPPPQLSSLVRPRPRRYPDSALFRSRMSTSRFVHLHVHTEFSLADSTIRVPEKPDQADPKKAKQANLLSRAVEIDMPALAVTDLNNLFALVKFYKAAEGVGIKPIAGADVMIATPDMTPWRMTLLCRDREGYLSLSRLLTRAWMEGHRPEGGVAIHPEWLQAGHANLFALAGRDSWPGVCSAKAAPTWPSNNWPTGSACSATACTWNSPAPVASAKNASTSSRSTQRAYAGCRSWPVMTCGFFICKRLQRTRSARVHFLGPRARRPQAPARLQRPAVPEIQRGDGGIVRRHPRRDRQHPRAGATLQHRDAPGHLLPARLPGAGRRDAGQLDPQPIARRSGRTSGKKARLHRARRARTTWTGSNSSWTPSSTWASLATF